ncbi:hypothetical protein Aduo_004320 [Ancylostoma duodenale]
MFDRSSLLGLLSTFAVILIFGTYIALLATVLCNIRLKWLFEENAYQDDVVVRRADAFGVMVLDENESFVLLREKLRLRTVNISRDAIMRRLYNAKLSQNLSQT